MTALVQDLRLAVRVLLGTRTWTLVVLLSLALGIGANTALFTAVNGLLLQTVNVHEPERLVRFNHVGPNDTVRNSNDYGYSGRSGTRNIRSTFSFPMIEELRAANTTLTGLAAGVPMGRLNVLVNGNAQLATGYQATGNYFTVIGVPAVLGRVFAEADDRSSAPPVAVISHAYWNKRFGGEPSAIGRVVSINGQMVTIVGVTPADFTGIERLGADAPDVTVPLAFDALFAPPARVEIPRMRQPTYWWLQLVGRLKPGVSIEQAGANFAMVFQRTALAGMAAYQSSLTADEKALSTNRQRGTAVPELLINRAAHGYYDVLPQTRRSAGFLSVVVVIGPAGRLRQRRESPPDTWDRANPGDLGASLAWRHPRPAAPSAAHGESSSLERWRGARRPPRVLAAGAASVRPDGAARLASVRIPRRHQHADRGCLRPPAGRARDAG